LGGVGRGEVGFIVGEKGERSRRKIGKVWGIGRDKGGGWRGGRG